MANEPDPDIPILTRGIGRIEPGIFAAISYNPTRGKAVPRDRHGTADEVNRTEEGLIQFRFYDESREREIEVTVAPTTGDSEVRSRKDDRWTTLGTLLRVGVSEDADEFEEYALGSAQEHFEGRHESIIAVAEVEWNSRILDWFDWSEQNA